MALVRPFRALVYRHAPGEDISTLVAPPYDVISPSDRLALLARNPHNVVALELPDGGLDPSVPGNRYENGARTWREWIERGVLVEDESPAIYVLEQSWEHSGRHVRRRAFIAAVELHAFDEGVILPHERTLPKALADRLNLIRATAANLSQVLGLYSDPAGETDAVLDAAVQGAPLFEATDAEGVRSRIWAIRDQAMLAAVGAIIGDRQIFIADGHHRYTTALAYRDERRAKTVEAGSPEGAAYDAVMMALVNMDDPELVVLPTHRQVRALTAFDPAAFWRRLTRWFDLSEIRGVRPTEALVSAERTAFVVRTSDGTTRLATLRADVDPAEAIPGPHSPDWKRLDVAVLQELVLRPVFGIDPDDPASLERLSFVKDADEALRGGDADVTFLLAPTRMEQLLAVALGGEMMPQKSTYFYPKLLSGLLFRSLD